MRQALDQRGCTRVAIGAASPLQPELDEALAGLQVRRFERPLEQWKGDLFDAVDAGVTAAAGGIAETGTLVLRPGADEPRTLSLVPPVHVAVLTASCLYARLPAALQAWHRRRTCRPTCCSSPGRRRPPTSSRPWPMAPMARRSW